MKKSSQYLFHRLVALVALAACASHETQRPAQGSAGVGNVRVVAIERVYGDLAQQLAGTAASVTTILNSPSADPHAYEPSPRDADAVAAADILIENGLGYDAFADKLVAGSPREGRTRFIVGTLGGHRPGDNPHVWYETATLRRLTDTLATELGRRLPSERGAIVRRRDGIDAWIVRVDARLRSVASRHAGARVAITEPVFDYVLHAARLNIATPESFSHAIEEGNDPAPQDVETMRALLANRHVTAFVYNRQAVEPATTHLLEVAGVARVTVVPVTETLPAGQTTQTWIDAEVAALDRAL